MVEFEHTLFQLLLLIGILNAKPPHYKYVPFIIGVGLLLAFLPPIIPLGIPWHLVMGLTLPLLLWQNARWIINSDWRGRWKELFLWIGTALLFGLILILTKALNITGAILFGLIIASMLWRSGESERTASIISQIGPLTLVFLLVEIEPMVETPSRYLRGIVSGASFGIAIALTAFFLNLKITPRIRNWIAIGQIYIAYGFASLIGVSAISASLASVIVYVALGWYRGLWFENELQPAPMNTWPGFILLLLLFLVLGWQSHHPVSLILFFEVIIGCVIGLTSAWVGRSLKLPSFSARGSIWRAGLNSVLLFFPSLLLWPRESLQEPILLTYALGIAVAFLVLWRMTREYFFKD